MVAMTVGSATRSNVEVACCERVANFFLPCRRLATRGERGRRRRCSGLLLRGGVDGTVEVMAQRRQGFFVAAAAEEEYFSGGRGWKEAMERGLY